jgi:chaperonin GroES
MEMDADEVQRHSDVTKLITELNIADKLDEATRKEIGLHVFNGYEIDKKSRLSWEEQVDEWTKLALLTAEDKTWPWPGASNVKYPLMATACMQFSARAYPSLVPSDGKIVRANIIGADPTGEKFKRATRVAKHMSYQILEEMPDWEEDMDKLLYITAIVGTGFKKTYFDSKLKCNVSKLVMPKDLVVNYWSKSLEESERKTEVIYMSKRTLKSRQLQGQYLDVDLPTPTIADKKLGKENTKAELTPVENDNLVPYTILEQHGYWDLDDDGLPEPYVFIVEESTKTLLRMVARFTEEGVKTNPEGKVFEIEPIEYYTKFSFIPNPDGSFYDIGFGLLMSPLNNAVDSLLNQLVDAGTLANLQSGFIGKGLRIKLGESRFTPGEWKAVNATADDLRKQIVPLPAAPPSDVLFKLLNMLVDSGMKLASVAEIFTGKMPGQNTPAYTTKETVEQGSKVFTAIYKRIFRALKKEFQKLYLLNHWYLDDETLVNVLDEPVSIADYEDDSYDIVPAADPNAASQTDKMAKFQHAMQLMPLGTLDPMAMTMRGLDAAEIPAPQELINKQPKGPPPEVQMMQEEMKMKQAESQMKMQIEQMKAQIKAAEGQQKLELEKQMGQMKMQFEAIKAQLDLQTAQAKMQQDQVKGQMDMQAHAASTQLNLQTQAATHAQKLKQQKEQAAAKPQPKPKGKN